MKKIIRTVEFLKPIIRLVDVELTRQLAGPVWRGTRPFYNGGRQIALRGLVIG